MIVWRLQVENAPGAVLRPRFQYSRPGVALVKNDDGPSNKSCNTVPIQYWETVSQYQFGCVLQILASDFREGIHHAGEIFRHATASNVGCIHLRVPS